MNKEHLALGHYFSHGWDTLWANWKLMVLGIIISASPFLVASILRAHHRCGAWLALILYTVIVPPVMGGWSFLCLKLVRDRDASLSDILMGFWNFPKLWATEMLLILLLSLGLLLFVIPSVIWTLKYGLAIYVVMDKRLAPHRALGLSGRITKGHRFKLLGLLLVSLIPYALNLPLAFGIRDVGSTNGLVLMAVGIILYLLNLLVLEPWLSAAWATAYDVLNKQYELTANSKGPPTGGDS